MNRSSLLFLLSFAAAIAMPAWASMPDGAGDPATPAAQESERETVYGYDLMTEEERDAHRRKMHTFRTEEERARYLREHHVKMHLRAKERGVELPDEPALHDDAEK